MTKFDDAIYNLLKNYYEIMDFFNNRDEAFYIYIYIYIYNKKKETFCIGGLRPWACPLAYTKNNPFLFLFLLKRTTPFKLDKNGKCIKAQQAINRTLLQYAICKTKLYILCVHLRKLIPKRLICVFINTKFEKIPNFLFQGCPILVGLERALALLLLLLL